MRMNESRDWQIFIASKQGESIADIAKRIGLSNERIRQIIWMGERRCRHPTAWELIGADWEHDHTEEDCIKIAEHYIKNDRVEKFRQQHSNGVPNIEIIISMKEAGYTNRQIGSVLDCTKEAIDRSITLAQKRR